MVDQLEEQKIYTKIDAVHSQVCFFFATKDPMWGYPRCGLGAVGAVLEPFCGHLSPKNDKVSSKLTFEYPHEGPCVDLPSHTSSCPR